MRAAPAVVAVLLMLPVGASLGPGAAPAAGSFVSPAQTPLFVSFTANVTEAPPNATISLHLRSFFWAEPTDLDELEISHVATGLHVAFAHVGTGVYEAGFIMPSIPAGAFGKTQRFRANATLGGESLVNDVAVGSQRSSLTLQRLDNGSRDSWGAGIFGPGETIHYEVTETDSGRAADLGVPNIEVQVSDGFTNLIDDPLAGTPTPARVGVGTYRFELTIPPSLASTREYQVEATLEPASSGSEYPFGLRGYDRARVARTPVTSYLTHATNESADITVLVGDADPVAGAQVVVSAPIHGPSSGHDPMAVLLNETTGPWGMVQAHIQFPDNRTNRLRLDVVEEGFTSTWAIWVPDPWPPPRTAGDPGPPPAGFVAFTTVLDSPAVDVVRLRVQVFQEGSPVANTSLAHLVLSEYFSPHAPEATGNITTDAEGAFVLEASPAPLWGWGSRTVYLWNATGARTVTGYDGRPPVPSGTFLPVTAQGTAVGEPIQITAEAAAMIPLATGQVLGYASVYPAGSYLDPLFFPNDQDTFTRYGGRPPAIDMWPNTSVPGTINGTATVPYWWPPGDYVVSVYAYNLPVNEEDLSSYWYLHNTTLVHLSPTTREPPPPPEPELVGTSETFIPGAGPAVVVLALVGAAAAPRVAARRLGR